MTQEVKQRECRTCMLIDRDHRGPPVCGGLSLDPKEGNQGSDGHKQGDKFLHARTRFYNQTGKFQDPELLPMPEGFKCSSF